MRQDLGRAHPPPAFVKALRKARFEVIQTPLSEFMKAGGSAKCLTLRLDEP